MAQGSQASLSAEPLLQERGTEPGALAHAKALTSAPSWNPRSDTGLPCDSKEASSLL